MQISFLTFWNNYRDEMSDAEFFKMENAINKLAEPLGFDTLLCVEHHFNAYSMSPDNFQYLSYLAGVTEKIKLGTMGAILPWNDPIRVAEKAILLDHLSEGRAIFGMARGLAKREYTAFRQDLEESRERFDEAAVMICDAIESGSIEGSGPYYPQPKTPIRPGPLASFAGRKLMVAMSPDTVPVCARVGAVQGMFAYKPWPDVLPTIEEHRRLFREYHGRSAPPVLTADLCFCGDDEERARDIVGKYFESFADHYEIFGDHLKESKSYSEYSGIGAAREQVGFDAMVEAFIDSNVWGTPQKILDKYETRRAVIGDFQPCAVFSYSGMTFDEAERSATLYAKEVIPELRSWGMGDSETRAA